MMHNEMKLVTERLVIFPFTLELFEAINQNDPAKYEKLSIIPDPEFPEKDMREAISFFEDLTRRNGVTGFSSWIALTKQNEIVGSLGYFGEPVDGTVEVGFGMIPRRRNQGYCTEATAALMNWAFQQPGVSKVIASCDTTNVGSRRILERLGFTMIRESGGLFQWECKKRSTGQTD